MGIINWSNVVFKYASIWASAEWILQFEDFLAQDYTHLTLIIFLAEPPAFEVLPSLKRLKQRVIAAGRGQYDAVFMSGRYTFALVWFILLLSLF